MWKLVENIFSSFFVFKIMRNGFYLRKYKTFFSKNEVEIIYEKCCLRNFEKIVI